MMKEIDLKHGERYPEVLSVNLELRKVISKKYGFKIEDIIPNNGSNGSLLTIFSTIKVNNNKPKVILDVPNYFRSIYHLLHFKYKVIAVKQNKNFEFPVKDYIKKMLKYKPDLVMLTTPNNPTGKAISDRNLISVLDSLPKESIAVVDRTLTNIRKEISTKTLLSKYKNKNLVILHSFSKNYGLSHERIGFAVTSNRNLSDFLRQFVVLGLNVNAMKSAIRTMKKFPLIKEKIKKIKESDKLLERFSKNFNFVYYKSDSDYALLKLPRNIKSSKLCKEMKKGNISLMGGHEFHNVQNINESYIRLYIGEPARLMKFIKTFKNITKK